MEQGTKPPYWYNYEQRDLLKPDCLRCNDNGCPACDGTHGSLLNPEPY
jgi:hypothetical protein